MGGDSAGANLAVSLAIVLRDQQLRAPKGPQVAHRSLELKIFRKNHFQDKVQYQSQSMTIDDSQNLY